MVRRKNRTEKKRKREKKLTHNNCPALSYCTPLCNVLIWTEEVLISVDGCVEAKAIHKRQLDWATEWTRLQRIIMHTHNIGLVINSFDNF